MFKIGDKITYLGYPGEITYVGKDQMDRVYYSVSYDKGTGKTKASNILVKSGDVKAVNEVDEATEEEENEGKTYKKGDKLKIKLKNGNEFDLTFDSYGRQKGMAFGKFKDGSGEYDTKPFSLDTIKESVVNEAMISSSGVKALRSGHKIKNSKWSIYYNRNGVSNKCN